MSYINYPCREISFKIVYYGPGMCGKTTNVEYIHRRTPPAAKGQLISLKTESERTLFFDFMPLEIGKINGFRARLQIYTVPGQIFYKASRQLILRGVDGVVFVADSQVWRTDANVASMQDLHENLEEHGFSPDTIPLVIQYNKRDLCEVEPVERLRALLNPAGVPDFEGMASSGGGVFATLKAIVKLVLVQLTQKYQSTG